MRRDLTTAIVKRLCGGRLIEDDVVPDVVVNSGKGTADDPRVEAVADAAHEAWSGWMGYLFEKSVENEDGTVTIPKEQVERWRRQVATPYAEMPDEEKESDREEARKYIAAMHPGEEKREPGVGPDEEPPERVPTEPEGKTREPYHSMDPHDGAGEDDGW